MKRHHILKKCLLMTNMLFFSGGLVSCNSTFFGNSESVEIKSVTPTYDEKSGNTIITIAFVDEDVSPVTFSIPRGLSGKDGVGIQDVSAKMSDDKKNVELTIKYTDTSVQDTVLTVPYLGISNVEVSLDEETGSTDIVFCYTDGTKSQKISIPKGKDGDPGEDGIGIKSFVVETVDGVTTVTVTFTDSDKMPSQSFIIKDGIGIDHIESVESDDPSKYVLKIVYSDDFSHLVEFDKPKDGKDANRWYSGATAPEGNPDLASAVEGDFYINLLSGYVYQKVDDVWKFLFGMKGDSTSSEKTRYHVYFDPVEGTIDGVKTIRSVDVVQGETVPLDSIPLPVLENKTFDGWYTDLSNVNAGRFTDMTPVCRSMVLKAKYIKW